MLAELEVADYLKEIREQVCSRCVERPPGGPPCEPLGKQCGVELHLSQLIDSIHEVHSPMLQPYLEHNRQGICANCALLHSDICPCPMDYLSSLIVEAVEHVDQRHVWRRQISNLIDASAEQDEIGLEDIEAAYAEASETWTGCDWPTHFGFEGLNLQGMTPSQAKARAAAMPDAEKAAIWIEASKWLANVERYAASAENEAYQAVAAAKAGEWKQALHHARRAWAFEFATGRSLRNQGPRTWLGLALIMDQAARAHESAELGGGD